MIIGRNVNKIRRGIAVTAAAVIAMLFLAQDPAQARVDTGAAVGIGLGSFALGTALGASANPYYNPYYAPYGYPAPAYYPPAPYYPAPRNCWDPYYRRYYAC